MALILMGIFADRVLRRQVPLRVISDRSLGAMGQAPGRRRGTAQTALVLRLRP